MDRQTVSWLLIALAVLLGAAAVCIWAWTVETVQAGGGKAPSLHSSARLAMACGIMAGILLLGALLVRIERRDRTPPPGRCACGYPLDETMGRCPECGRVRWRS